MQLKTEEKNYFIWQEVMMDVMYARSRLKIVNEEMGNVGVKKSGLIDTKVKF